MQLFDMNRSKRRMPHQSAAVLDTRLKAAAVGVDAVMADYVEASVLSTREGTFRALGEIRGFFSALLNGTHRGFLGSFKMIRQEIADDVRVHPVGGQSVVRPRHRHLSDPWRQDLDSDVFAVSQKNLTRSVCD
jgi:hypothetical protein